MTMPDSRTEPLYPESRAFVVQIERRVSQPVGRVEHIATGRARRFEGLDQLADFVSSVLGELDRTDLGGSG